MRRHVKNISYWLAVVIVCVAGAGIVGLTGVFGKDMIEKGGILVLLFLMALFGWLAAMCFLAFVAGRDTIEK